MLTCTFVVNDLELVRLKVFLCRIVQSLEQLDLEETKKDLINREIRSFRDAHKVCIDVNWFHNVCEVLPKPQGPWGGTDLSFLNPQPDTSLHWGASASRGVLIYTRAFAGIHCVYPQSSRGDYQSASDGHPSNY